MPSAKQNANETLNNLYNALLALGFRPFNAEEPFAPNSALVLCASLSGKTPSLVLRALTHGSIEEKPQNYNADDPLRLLRHTLDQAGMLGNLALKLETLPEEDDEDAPEALKRARLEIVKRDKKILQLETKAKAREREARDDKKAVLQALQKVQKTEDIYANITEQFIKPVPKAPLAPQRKVRRKNGRPVEHLIASADYSDSHATETVMANEVRGVSAFDMDILNGRNAQFTEAALQVCDDRASDHVVYDGFVLNLLGDIISGNIHEDSRRSNRTKRFEDSFGRVVQYSASGFQAAFEAKEGLSKIIRAFADRFGIVKVPGVVGNHGRDGKDISYKGHVFDSYDYLVYKLLEMEFAKDPRVEIIPPIATDMTYDVYGYRFLITHGDRMGVKGGDGFIGNIGPIMRGNKKIREFDSNYYIINDYMLIGHYHNYQTHRNLIVNGSLKGPDEYSTLHRYNPEPPTQALFFVHPKRGILCTHPLICDYMYRDPKKYPVVPLPDPKVPFKVILGGGTLESGTPSPA